jgi:sugar/nucleoside kinase (ribokinase family)
VVVVGDLAVDVLVAPSVALVADADVPARITTAGGGAGATTAAWLADRGVDVTLVARAGDDAAVQEIRAAGVRDAVAVELDASTATVVVLLGPHGERTMLSARGAAGRLAPADLPSLRGVDHPHLSATCWAIPGRQRPVQRRWSLRARPVRASPSTRRRRAWRPRRRCAASAGPICCCRTRTNWPP